MRRIKIVKTSYKRTKFYIHQWYSDCCVEVFCYEFSVLIHRIHKWRTRRKKLVPSHESEALEDKQKLQMKTFSELAECLARIPPKKTLYGLLFKYNYVGCLLPLMFSSDLLFAIKRDEISSRKQDDFVGSWTIAGEKRQTCWPKLHIETEYESQLTAIRWNRNINKSWWQEKKK